MLRRSSFFDMAFLLTGFTVCFSVELLLSVVLIYHGVRYHKPSAFLSFLQACLSIVGITAIVFALLSKDKLYLVDMAVRCNLHLSTGTNVRKSK
jgi:fumarate reductase subunit C